MKNKIVGYIVAGISGLMFLMILLFNSALAQIVNVSCGHGPECPMWGSIKFHTTLSIIITAFILLLGIYLIFFGQEIKTITKTITKIKRIKEQIKPKKITRENYRTVLAKLDQGSKKIFESVIDANGSIYQSKLVEKTGLSKVKVTRLLDKLQGKGLIDRSRRGMTNIIVLKHSSNE